MHTVRRTLRVVEHPVRAALFAPVAMPVPGRRFGANPVEPHMSHSPEQHASRTPRSVPEGGPDSGP